MAGRGGQVIGQAERKKRETWVQAFWHLGDLVAILGGFLAGYWIRFDSPLTSLFPPDKGVPDPALYFYAGLLTAAVWIPLMHGRGLYRFERGKARHGTLEIVRTQAFGMLLVVALSFFYRETTFSRLALPFIWASAVLLTIAGRFLIQGVIRRTSVLRPIRFVVVGAGPSADRVVRSLERSGYPHQCVGRFQVVEEDPAMRLDLENPGLNDSHESGSDLNGSGEANRDLRRSMGEAGGPAAAEAGDSRGEEAGRSEGKEAGDLGGEEERDLEPLSLPTLGPSGSIHRKAADLNLDLVVLAAPTVTRDLLQQVYRQCQRLDLDFLFVPELFSLWGSQVRVEEASGMPLIRLRDLSLTGWNGVAKRTLDLIVSGILLLLVWPLLLALALAVRLSSPGPVFHRQVRVGRDRRPFEMLKFRSMRVDAEAESGPVWATEEDPRRTRVGVFLRKWSLDELPQLWNVFRGQMSLVGPRPERPVFVQRFEGEVLDYYDRHRVKSGMTGWAQVHGLRGDTPIEVRTRYDLFYVENWSIWLDLRILAMTVWAVFRHRGS